MEKEVITMENPKASTQMIADAVNWKSLRNPKYVVCITILTIIYFGFALYVKMKGKGYDLPLITGVCVVTLVFMAVLLRTLYVLCGDRTSSSYESSRREESLRNFAKMMNPIKFVAALPSINNTSAADVTNTMEIFVVMIPPTDDTSASAASNATDDYMKSKPLNYTLEMKYEYSAS